jgi:thiol-disulfide isomerase/thioredoxin
MHLQRLELVLMKSLFESLRLFFARSPFSTAKALFRKHRSNLESHSRQKSVSRLLLGLILTLSCLLLGTSPALAGLNDDHYDGNIFPLYAGNGSLIPPRATLTEALRQGRPTLLVFYVDDSSDCKRYAAVVSQLDAFYGRAADFIPVSIDSIPPKSTYAVNEPGYYYGGVVPQTVLLDQSGKAVLNAEGVIPFEQVDDAFREVFDLLPRSQSVELKRRQVNEVSTELVE